MVYKLPIQASHIFRDSENGSGIRESHFEKWTLKKKGLNGLFSLLHMESLKVQKVSHWLSKE